MERLLERLNDSEENRTIGKITQTKILAEKFEIFFNYLKSIKLNENTRNVINFMQSEYYIASKDRISNKLDLLCPRLIIKLTEEVKDTDIEYYRSSLQNLQKEGHENREKIERGHVINILSKLDTNNDSIEDEIHIMIDILTSMNTEKDERRVFDRNLKNLECFSKKVKNLAVLELLAKFKKEKNIAVKDCILETAKVMKNSLNLD